MKLEQGIIRNSQLTYMTAAFMQSMALTAGFSFSFTKQNTWLVVIAAFVISMLAALMYLAIAKRYPGKNLVEINDEVFGKSIGMLFSLLYIWFFFQLIIHYLFFFNTFWLTYIMPETPRYAFLIMFGIISAYAVRNGLEVIARCCFLFAVIVWATTVTLAALLLSDMNPSFLLPLFDTPLKAFVQSTHIMVSISFCDIVVFLMIFPYTADEQKLKKPFLIGIIVTAVQLLVVVLRDILSLGPRVGSSVSASFAAARQINLANILTRMDVLVAISLLIAVFTKITIFSYVTILGSAQVLKLRSYKPLVIPIVALAVIIGAVLYPSDMEQVYAAQYVWPFNTIVFEMLLPAVTLATIGIKSLAEEKKVVEDK